MKCGLDRLGDYVDILSGYAFKSKDFMDKGVPVIKIKNVTPPNVSLKDLSYVSSELAQKVEKYVLEYDDVLIAMTGSHINQWASVVGRVARVKYSGISVLNQRVGKLLIKDSSKADKNYIYYFLSQNTITKELASKAGGAANQANINPSDIKELRIPRRDFHIQKKIGSILRKYDDLIENNQKQIKLLEEAAQRLYKEWFVDLRFPGHENVKIVDGVPEGWEKKELCELGDIVTGKTPSTSVEQYYGNDIPFVTIPDMHGHVFPLRTEKSLSFDGANSQKSKYLPEKALMVSCIGTVGLVNITVTRCQTNQQINSIMLFNEKDLYYLYQSMKSLAMLLDGIGSNGTTMTNVNKEKFSHIMILVPDRELMDKYFEFCEPLFNNILMCSKKVLSLQEARDRLLPKLMSGEIEV